MPKSDSSFLMPVLSAGRHRNPRRGACFMEFASWLAGESWSDRPACTHPALASLARLVNDCSTTRGRAKLPELIPSVIGLVDDDPLTSLLVAVRAAGAAIPIAREDRQRALAAGLLCLGRYLEPFEGPVAATGRRLIREGLLTAPAAARWAEEFAAEQPAPRQRDIPRVCEAALRVSVVGIAEACVEDPDAVLRNLLVSAIADLAARVRPQVEPGTTERGTTEQGMIGRALPQPA